jgi:exopolysaccharide biosynthesis polyprenyl glycosylphosphotransferase
MTDPVRIRIKLALLGGDLFLLTLCLAVGTYIRLRDVLLLYQEYGTAWLICLLLYPLGLYLGRAYELQPEARSADNLRRPLLGFLIAATATSVVFFFAPDIRFGRGIFAIANTLYAGLLLAWRLGIFLHLRRRRLAILLMGDADGVETARQLIREFSPYSQTQVWHPGSDAGSAPVHLNPRNLSSARNGFDLLILTGQSHDPGTLSQAAAFRLQGVPVWDLPRLYAEFAQRLPASYIDEGWIATAEGFRSMNETSYRVIKRLADTVVATLGLLLCSPLLALAAILIKLEDGGAVRYSQERVGRGGKPFRVHKLRTMVSRAEAVTGPVWASPSDPRVTRVGRWLRKLRIDEIPQMWNVLTGEMSFVGPRPERPVFVEALQSKFPVYSLRHLVRPGITGWAQVHCRYAASEEDNLRKLEYDLYYLQNASVLLDVRIYLKTISTVASAWGSW